MRTLVSSTFQHFYRLLRNYFVIGAVGTSIALLYGLLSTFSTIANLSLLGIGLFFVYRALFINRPYFKDCLNTFLRYRDTVWYRDAVWIRRWHGLLEVREHPPVVAHFILHVLLPDENRDLVLSDLHKIYVPILNRTVNKYWTKFFADFWYWRQVLSSIIPLLLWRLRSLLNDRSFPVTFREDIEDILPFYRKRR